MKFTVVVYEKPPENGRVRFYPWFYAFDSKVSFPLVPHVWEMDLFNDDPDGCRKIVIETAIKEANKKVTKAFYGE